MELTLTPVYGQEELASKLLTRIRSILFILKYPAELRHVTWKQASAVNR